MPFKAPGRLAKRFEAGGEPSGSSSGSRRVPGPSLALYEATAFLRSLSCPAVGTKSDGVQGLSASIRNVRAASVLNSPMSFTWTGG